MKTLIYTDKAVYVHHTESDIIKAVEELRDKYINPYTDEEWHEQHKKYEESGYDSSQRPDSWNGKKEHVITKTVVVDWEEQTVQPLCRVLPGVLDNAVPFYD